MWYVVERQKLSSSVPTLAILEGSTNFGLDGVMVLKGPTEVDVDGMVVVVCWRIPAHPFQH